MKLAILLTGLTGTVPGQKPRNWRSTAESIKSKVIDCFTGPAYETKIYLTTYNSADLHDIISYYNPTKTLILPYSGSHQRTTYIASLEQLIYEDVDFIISTRFDLNFNEPISQLPYRFDRFNFIFREIEPYWSQDQFVGDCFFAFPKVFLTGFIESIRREQSAPYRICHDLHPVYRHLKIRIGEGNCHFLHDGCHDSSNNQFFEVMRH